MNAKPQIASPQTAGNAGPSLGLLLGSLAVCLVGLPSYAGAQCYSGPSRCCPCPSPYRSPSEAVPSPEGMPPRPEGAPQAPTPEEAINFAGAAENVAAAPSTFASNMFGDSLLPGFQVNNVNLPFLAPGTGHRFNIADNQNPLPQDRVYFDYNFFSDPFTIKQFNAAGAQIGSRAYDLNRYLFGAEATFLNGLGSVQIQVPFRSSLSSSYSVADTGPITAGEDTEFDNIALAVKLMLYRDCCLAVSCGSGIDLPTARDVDIAVTTAAGSNHVSVDNKAVILSPFLGMLYTPCDCYFVESFAQLSLPVDTNPLHFVASDGTVSDFRLHDLSFFHFDIACGTWLYRNECMCCNCQQGLRSVAAVAEAHYTTKIGGSDNFSDPTGNLNVNTTKGVNLVNLTFGLDVFYGETNIRPAIVIPVNNDAKDAFDWEFTLQINRFFN